MTLENTNNLEIIVLKYLAPSLSKNTFGELLNKIFAELSIFNEKYKERIIPFVIFHKLMQLPLIISKHFYRVLISRGNDFCFMNFANGMTELYYGTLEEKIEILFSICDLDQDGSIVQEDIELIMKYLHYNGSYQKNTVIDKQSLSILHNMIALSFTGRASLTLPQFKDELLYNPDLIILFFIFFELCKPIDNDSKNNLQKKFDNVEEPHEINSTLKCLLKEYTNIMGKCTENLLEYLHNRFDSNEDYPNDSNDDSLDEIDLFEREVGTIIKDASIMKNDTTIFSNNNGMNNFPMRHASSQLKSTLLTFPTLIGNNTKSAKSSNNISNVLKLFLLPTKTVEQTYDDLRGIIEIEGKSLQVSLFLIKKNLFLFHNKKIVQIINMSNYCISYEIKHLNASNESIGSILLTPYYSSFLKQKRIVCKHHDSMIDFVNNAIIDLNQRNITNEYHFLEEISKGNNTIIFKGNKIKEPEIIVAIKKVSKNIKKQHIIECIETEKEIMVLLQKYKHDNIINIIDMFESEEYYYYIEEYLPKGTLTKFLDRKVLSDINEFKGIMNQIINATSFLHSFGIIHRDIKSDNILIADNADKKDIVLKVNDFGLSKIIGYTEKADEACGSLCFTAPEILHQRPYNHNVDIWSIGIVSFYIWYHKVPFYDIDINLSLITEKIKKGKFSFPKQMSSSLIKQDEMFIHQIISRCLNILPENRININELLNLCHYTVNANSIKNISV